MKYNLSRVLFWVGIIFVLIGIYMSVVLKNPHFYTIFSVGLFIVTTIIFNKLSPRKLFQDWSVVQHLIFWTSLAISSILIDEIGLALQYWSYPFYASMGDEVLKIIFEFVIALMCFMNVFLILKIVFSKKQSLSTYHTGVFSFLISGPLLLLCTEYINSFSHSWRFMIPSYVWYTIGAWAMVIVPLYLFKVIDGVEK